MCKRLLSILAVLLSISACARSISPASPPWNPDLNVATLGPAQHSETHAAGLGTIAGMPPLPLYRSARGLVETSKDGVQTYARSASAVDVSPVLQLSAGSGEWVFGVWELPAVDELRYLDVELTLPQAEQQTGGVYIALANYSTQRWEIQGQVVSGRVLELNPAIHTSPGLAMYAAVIAHDGAEALVQKLSLVAFHSNLAPSAVLGADFTSGDAPLAVQFDASGSTDPEGSIARYLWDFEGDGVFDGITLGASAQHVYASPGIFNVIVAVEDIDGELGQANLEITVNLPGNTLPGAALWADPVSGQTPLDVGFDAASFDPDGTVVRRDWDFEGDGIWDAYDAGDTISHTYAAAGAYTATVRVTDNLGAQAEDTVDITVTAGNSAPSAQLTILPNDLQLGEESLLDASQSSDLDGTIEQYEWDTDGNGSFETNSGSDSTILLTTDTLGSYAVRVRVTDDAGGMAIASALISVHGWKLTAPDNANDTGYNSCLVLVNGKPAMCYYDATVSETHYVRAQDEAGASWGTPVTLGGSTQYSWMAIVNGRPAIAYSALTDMLYVRALDSDGIAWPAPVTVDSSGDTGLYNSLAVINGNPALSYFNGTTMDLRYARATDADGTAWDTPVTVDFLGSTGAYTSLAEVNGRPAISYYNVTNGDLRFVRGADAVGLTWDGPLTLDSLGTTGTHTTLLVVAGRPAICYYDQADTLLRFIRASDADGTAWGTALGIGSAGSSGPYSSLAIINGRPAIGLYSVGDLAYVRAADSSGSSWGAPELVDTPGDTGWDPSLMEVNGGPAISFLQFSNGDLLYAWGF